eukprot:SAG11_NODE_22614_length_403_cov_0.513158_1_plen_98_part_01
MVLFVHLGDAEGTLIADVGLGEATRLPMPLSGAKYTWEEAAERGAAFRYSIERLDSAVGVGCGRWRFSNDSSASFEGFDVDGSTSAASVAEFERYHQH